MNTLSKTCRPGQTRAALQIQCLRTRKRHSASPWSHANDEFSAQDFPARRNNGAVTNDIRATLNGANRIVKGVLLWKLRRFSAETNHHRNERPEGGGRLDSPS